MNDCACSGQVDVKALLEAEKNQLRLGRCEGLARGGAKPKTKPTIDSIASFSFHQMASGFIVYKGG
jgi:hypothetical protein